ncbi:MAG: protein kinase [Chloroflexi bacterium]|nr:protein kinase [Chloroflexota bacterium]
MLGEQHHPPDVIKGRYRLVEPLGRGATSVVYRAHDETLGRDVAIKFLSPERILGPEVSARFLREARTVARLAHPNIMTLHDVDREDTWHFLVLELIPGRNLHTLLVERGGTYPVDEALAVMRGALAGLVYAHGHGVIHRDIKPENIMCTPDGYVKLTDFGMALTHEEVRLTQTGTIMGTVLYMAPEVLGGEEADARTDLYSLGVVLYELLVGEVPFAGDSLVEIASQILHAPLPALDSIPEQLVRVVERLLAKRPAARYASAEEVLAALPDLSARTVEVPARQPPTDVRLFAALEDKAAAVEAERRRLAELLQRDVIQSLDLLLAQVGMYETSLGRDPNGRMALSVLSSLVRQTLQQVRDLETDLHPAILEAMGLEPALQALAQQANRAHGLQVTLHVARLAERLPGTLELALFRVAQDVLERCVRHARAARVNMRLDRHDERLAFSLSDDGVPTGGLALLRASRERIEQLGGESTTGIGPLGGLEISVTFALAPPVDLTPRELDVIELLAEGQSNKEIGSALSISPRTVNYHLDNIYSKLGVNSRTEAAIVALRQGWVRADPR